MVENIQEIEPVVKKEDAPEPEETTEMKKSEEPAIIRHS